MAKYEDYAKRFGGDDLQDEIKEAGQQTQERREKAPELPPEYQGKSAREIAEMHMNLQAKFNERNDILGQQRRQIDELIALETVRQAQPAEPVVEDPVTVDDLYENPEGTISKVVERTSSKKIEDLERQVAESQRALALRDFTSRHPDALTDAKSAEFQEWVAQSPYRQRLMRQADKYDFDAANDLFEMYYESQGGESRADPAAEQRREQQLRDAELESGGAEAYDLEPKFSRSDIISRKLAAKRGDQEAEMWLRANQDAIAIAYETGNIVD